VRALRWRRPVLGLLALLGLVAGANLTVLLSTRDAVTTTARAPHAQAAIVLGARVQADGALSPMLADRVAQGLALYRAGTVDRIIVSGDHGSWSYDEPGAMRDALVAAGVPARDVFTDHAGFDTWDSMVRARKVFAVRSAIVVTQGFHMARALWLGKRAGLEVHGLAADRSGYGLEGRKSKLREVLARVKAVEDVVTGAKPRFLGPKVPVTGSAEASRG
jgi:SanA protein